MFVVHDDDKSRLSKDGNCCWNTLFCLRSLMADLFANPTLKQWHDTNTGRYHPMRNYRIVVLPAAQFLCWCVFRAFLPRSHAKSTSYPSYARKLQHNQHRQFMHANLLECHLPRAHKMWAHTIQWFISQSADLILDSSTSCTSQDWEREKKQQKRGKNIKNFIKNVFAFAASRQTMELPI